MRLTGNRGAVQLGAAGVVAAVIGLGVVVGVGLHAAGVGGSSDLEVGLDAVDYASCPRGAVIGALHRGDRVLATARDESGEWLEVRDPRDLDARVWVIARFVAPDGDTKHLPVGGCAARGALTIGPAPPITTTPGLPGAPTTTTTAVVGGGTAGGSAPSSSPGAAPGPAPVPAGDTTLPSIGVSSASPAAIYDKPGTCSVATTSVVRVPVSDDTAVQSVTIAWHLFNRSGQATASFVNGQYQATVGPFDAPVGGVLPAFADLTVSARDAAGNQAQSSTSSLLRVNACPG
jgi:hypothetical protein